MRHINILTLLLLLLSLLFGMSLVGCGYKGNGNVTVERRHVGKFNSVLIEQQGVSGLSLGSERVSGFLVRFIQDTAEYASIEYDENLMHHIKTQSVNNRLLIRTQKALYSKHDISINIHYKQLHTIDASSFAQIIFATPFRGNTLDINLTGACDIKGKVYANRLNMDITGASDIKLEGQVRKMKGDFSGAGSLSSFGLKTDSCILHISGAAEAKVNVAEYLKVDASGAAEVVYKGSPVVVQDISGAGEVIKSKKE